MAMPVLAVLAPALCVGVALAPMPARGAAQAPRILQLGDSHTEAMSALDLPRRSLQRRFGPGAGGFSLPWKGPGQHADGSGATRGWHPIVFAGSRGRDAMVGLAGRALEARGRGARAWTTVGGDRVRLYLLRQPGGGVARVSIDGVSMGRHALSREVPEALVLSFELSPDEPHRLEVETETCGAVRILGVSQEAGTGLTYSMLGVRGARASWLARLPANLLETMLRVERPDVLVLAFGTNEAVAPTLNATQHRKHLRELLHRVHRAVPGAAVVLVAPPDAAQVGPSPDNLERVTGTIRALGKAYAARVVELRTLMGGPGTIRAWRRQGLARPDLIHFTAEGYDRLGGAIGEAVSSSLAAPAGRPSAPHAVTANPGAGPHGRLPR